MFFALVLLTCLTMGEATFCSFDEEDTLYIYPSPRNCSNFLACINFEEYEFECIKAPYFIPWSKNAICVEDCPSEASTKKPQKAKQLTEMPPDPALYPDEPAETIVCPQSGETKAAVYNSCSSYIDCNDGVGTKKNCSEGKEFSPKEYKCVEKSKSGCRKDKKGGSFHTKCRYQKPGDNILFPSESCHSFKKCANQLVFTIDCAGGCNYNRETERCDYEENFKCQLTDD